MNTRSTNKTAKLENLARAVLGIALILAALWAITDGGVLLRPGAL